MDKNVSISCTEQLLTCIRNICYKIVDEGEENTKAEFNVPVNDIIDMVKEEFGFFLPYLILKRSKRIKKVSFEKVINNDFKIRDMVAFKTSDFVLF
ncbi:hypothetical protein LCGC14_1923940 [marine sediment metagenome]|uniref:Uncharacterized protein n=1 Tax=marine sediment metagenome TaxID=412755 RepID=A0A0F9GDC1_9ZZZZ